MLKPVREFLEQTQPLIKQQQRQAWAATILQTLLVKSVIFRFRPLPFFFLSICLCSFFRFQPLFTSYLIEILDPIFLQRVDISLPEDARRFYG